MADQGIKLYQAGSYGRRAELAGYAKRRKARGFIITSAWLFVDEAADDGSVDFVDKQSAYWAKRDMEDVRAADVVVSFTDGAPARGGRPKSDEVEEWKDVPESRLGYRVSSFGRVVNGEGENISGKKSKGYLRVQPSGRVGGCVSVHQLVAGVFLGSCPEGLEIDHLDGDKANNWVGNLEYVTHLENIRRAEARGVHRSRTGVFNGRAKLTDQDVAEIRARVRAGETKAAVSRDYKVSDALIGRIVRGKLWPMNSELAVLLAHRGGRNVEYGLGIAWSKQTILVGPRERCFHYLPLFAHYLDPEAFLTHWRA